jgi:predicted transcriptional regulator of viral defense system
VAQSFPSENIKTLRGVLCRLAKQGKIGKHGRGRYRSRRSTSGEGTAQDAT